jgi:hypothetical protein
MTSQVITDEQAAKMLPTMDAAADVWGGRADIAALSNRLRAMLPGGNRLSAANALAVAQFALSTGANPFRGEIYGYEHAGKLVLVEGYKLLTRWAREVEPFTTRFYPLRPGETDDGHTIPSGAIAARCYVLRAGERAFFLELIRAEMPLWDALDTASTSALGIVTKGDRTTRSGRPMDPPKTWSWQMVAEKDALKNALRRAYGGRAMNEVARLTWEVEGVMTEPQDWDGLDHLYPGDREQIAKSRAMQRQREEEGEETRENLEAAEALWEAA